MSASPEEVPTNIERAATSTAIYEHTVDRGRAVVESRNRLRHSLDQQPEPETNLPADPFAGWHLCQGVCDWVNNHFWVGIKCSKPLTGSLYVDFEDYVSAAKYTKRGRGSSGIYFYELKCGDLPKAHDKFGIIRVDLLSCGPRLGGPYVELSVSRFPLGHFKYDHGEGRWEFVRRSADR
jgi:hypothetical protein